MGGGVAAGAGVYGVPLPMKRRRVASAAIVHNTSPTLAWSALHWARTSFSRSGLAISDSTDSVGAGLLHAASSRVQAVTVRRVFMVESSWVVVIDGGWRVGCAVALKAPTHFARPLLDCDLPRLFQRDRRQRIVGMDNNRTRR